MNPTEWQHDTSFHLTASRSSSTCYEDIVIRLIDENYYIISKTLESDDPNVIFIQAIALIEQINGAAALFFGHNNISTMKISNLTLIKEDGTKQILV
jgi:hypothetical protein